MQGRGDVVSVRDEIIGFAMAKGRLPVEDAGAILDDPDNLQELPKARAGDFWGQPFMYRVANELKTGNLCVNNTTLSLQRGTEIIADNIAFIIKSNGPNMQGDVTDFTTNSPLLYAIGEEVGGNAFDDIVEFVTLDHLKSRVGCTSTSSISHNFATMTDGQINDFISNARSPDSQNWAAGDDSAITGYTDGVLTWDTGGGTSRQFLFVPIPEVTGCNEYIIRTVGRATSNSFGGYGIFFDTNLYAGDYPEGYVLQFDPGSGGNMMIRRRSESGGTNVESGSLFTYGERQFNYIPASGNDWWTELHYIEMRVTNRPVNGDRLVQVYVHDLIGDFDENTFSNFSSSGPWQRRFSFGYTYPLASVPATIHSGFRGWNTQSFFYYYGIDMICPVQQSDLIAEYVFENISDIGKDTSGSGLHAGRSNLEPQNVNIFDTTPANISGTESTCRYANFNGTSGTSTEPSSSLYMGVMPLDVTDEITVMAWVRWGIPPGDGNSWANIITLGQGDAGQFALQHNSDNSRYEFALRTVGGRTYVLSATAPTQDTWQHVTGVFDGTNLSIYVSGSSAVPDATEVHSNPGNIQTHTASHALTVGRRNILNDYRRFNGDIDEVRIFNRALDAAEIEDWRELTRPCP